MNIYLKTTIAISFSLASLASFANYKVTYFLDKKDINFTNAPTGEWLKSSPFYSEWSYVGDYFDCKSASPTIESQDEGVPFTQTLSECSRNRTRSVQEREQNNQTQAYRDVGSAVNESEDENKLTYTKQLTGTNPSFTLKFGAGRYSTTGGTFVGTYARTNTGISIGSTILNDNGARVMLYYNSGAVYNAMTTCVLRYAVTSTTGWTPGGLTPPTAYNDINKYNYIDLYNGSNLYKRYSLSGLNNNSSETGYYRDVSVSCSDMLAFYNDTTFFSKAVFRKN